MSLKNCLQLIHFRSISSSTAAITRVHRNTYARVYPAIVVQPDGSSFTIRYHEPRKLIQLPLDLSTLTEAERKERVAARKPKQKIRIHEEIEDTFSARKYVKFVKSKK